MNEIYKNIIEKQDELILHLKRGMAYKDRFTTPEWKEELIKLESELSSLKAEAEESNIIECTTCGRKFSDEQEWDIHCEIGKCKEAEAEKEVSDKESYCTKCKKTIEVCECEFKNNADACKHTRIRKIKKGE